MPQVHLTAVAVRAAECPSDRRKLDLFDTEQQGFMLEVRASGGKTYYQRYINSFGRTKQFKIAPAGVVSLDDARRKAREIMAGVLLGGDPQAARKESRAILTFQEFIRDRYLPYVSSYKQSWQTDETILRVHAFPIIGRLRLDEIEANHGSALIKAMRDQEYAVGTINRVIVIVRYAINLARKWGLLKAATNPMSGLTAGPDVLRNRFLSAEETNRLIKELAVDQNRTAADAILLLLLTGARRNEITHALWEQVDFVKKTLYVPRSKSGKARWISLNSAAIALLTRRLDPAEKYIFPSPVTGKPSPSLYFPWDRIRTKAKLDGVRLHDLRHSFASVLVNQGVSLYVVQGLLGHANPRTAQRYAHLAQDTLTKASEVVADAVRPHLADVAASDGAFPLTAP